MLHLEEKKNIECNFNIQTHTEIADSHSLSLLASFLSHTLTVENELNCDTFIFIGIERAFMLIEHFVVSRYRDLRAIAQKPQMINVDQRARARERAGPHSVRFHKLISFER